MKNDTPMAGDRAIVLRCDPQPGLRNIDGEVVDVLSNPIYYNKGEVIGRSGTLWCAATHSGLISKYQFGDEVWWISTCKLLRIPPDDEMRVLFGETNSPVNLFEYHGSVGELNT